MGYGTVVIPNDLGKDETLLKSRRTAETFYTTVGRNAVDVQAEIFNGTFGTYLCQSASKGTMWSITHAEARFCLSRRGNSSLIPTSSTMMTYYLSLPYRYSLPLIAISATMHWLLSQGIFLAKVNALDVHGWKMREVGTIQTTSHRASLTAYVYSALAMFITILVGVMAMAVLLCFGLRHLRSNMPLALSCSAAISAACHPPPDDKDSFLKPVMRLEVPGQEESGRDREVSCRTKLMLRRHLMRTACLQRRMSLRLV